MTFSSWLFSCGNPSTSNASEPLTQNSQKGPNFEDTINKLIKNCNGVDTFSYLAFYGDVYPFQMFYFKMGELFDKSKKNVVALYTVNDTTIEYLTFALVNNEWSRNMIPGHLPVARFSPAYFTTSSNDYNFDGFTDLYVGVYMSMGLTYSYGFILTFNPTTQSLEKHEETLEIPNIEIDKGNQTLISTEYPNPNNTEEKYKIESRYQWTKGNLVLLRKSRIPE